MDASLNETFGDDMTGQIGTTLYVAPEMNAGKATATYNQKVNFEENKLTLNSSCYLAVGALDHKTFKNFDGKISLDFISA